MAEESLAPRSLAGANRGPTPFDYSGPAELEPAITAALRRVVDPEMALNIVDLGLVYRVELRDGDANVRLTMTSAACPVAEMIMDDVVDELAKALGEEARVDCDLVWEPPWTPERMGTRARSAMGWD
ncbi:MAG TPA: metal-sulfur cluster assembly factor [Usitatibacter sp.]|jgi:metal-sulfur cluster biosynthetic enzyme|nr:metal-sulfur cluster assembly factor [Usitatibacter sp.]